MTNKKLAGFLERTGLNAVKLAKELGVEHTTVYRYLNGKVKISRIVELALQTVERNRKL